MSRRFVPLYEKNFHFRFKFVKNLSQKNKKIFQNLLKKMSICYIMISVNPILFIF